MNKFQKKLLELVEAEGSQKVIAEKLDITPNYVSMLVNGERPLTGKLARILKKTYNIDVEELMLDQSLQKLGFSSNIINSHNTGSNIVTGNGNKVGSENKNEAEKTLSSEDLLEIIRKKDEQIASKDEQIKTLLDLLQKK